MVIDNLGNTINIKESIDKAINEQLQPVIELERLSRKEYLPAEDIAKLFSLEKNTLNTQRSRGVGPPYVKIGSKVLYSIEEVRAYLKRHTVKTLPNL